MQASSKFYITLFSMRVNSEIFCNYIHFDKINVKSITVFFHVFKIIQY